MFQKCVIPLIYSFKDHDISIPSWMWSVSWCDVGGHVFATKHCFCQSSIVVKHRFTTHVLHILVVFFFLPCSNTPTSMLKMYLIKNGKTLKYSRQVVLQDRGWELVQYKLWCCDFHTISTCYFFFFWHTFWLFAVLICPFLIIYFKFRLTSFLSRRQAQDIFEECNFVQQTRWDNCRLSSAPVWDVNQPESLYMYYAQPPSDFQKHPVSEELLVGRFLPAGYRLLNST